LDGGAVPPKQRGGVVKEVPGTRRHRGSKYFYQIFLVEVFHTYKRLVMWRYWIIWPGSHSIPAGKNLISWLQLLVRGEAIW